MVVSRITVNIKPGRLEEAVAVLRAEVERAQSPGATRIYWGGVAPLDVVAIESEYESEAQYETWSAEHWADPGTAVFMKHWNELRAGGGTNQLWTLAE
jgi:hypothetical protein